MSVKLSFKEKLVAAQQEEIRKKELRKQERLKKQKSEFVAEEKSKRLESTTDLQVDAGKVTEGSTPSTRKKIPKSVTKSWNQLYKADKKRFKNFNYNGYLILLEIVNDFFNEETKNSEPKHVKQLDR